MLIPKMFTTQPNPYVANLAKNYEPNPHNPSSYVLIAHALSGPYFLIQSYEQNQ
jgi:hypothetical protein